jgi:hypothetical protein
MKSDSTKFLFLVLDTSAIWKLSGLLSNVYGIRCMILIERECETYLPAELNKEGYKIQLGSAEFGVLCYLSRCIFLASQKKSS